MFQHSASRICTLQARVDAPRKHPRYSRPAARFMVMAGLLAAGLSGITLWQAPVAVAQTSERATSVRPEWAKLLREAQQALQAEQAPQALEHLSKVDALGARQPGEDDIYYRLLGVAAMRVNNEALATSAYENLLQKGQLQAGEAPQLQALLARLQFNTKRYPASMATADQTIQTLKATTPQSPVIAEMQLLAAKAAYLAKDHAESAKRLKSLIEADRNAQRAPAEDTLNLYASAQVLAKSQAGYRDALLYLVQYAPKPAYWGDLLDRTEVEDRLRIQHGRLALATGGLRDAEDVLQLAERLERAGHPLEGLSVLKQSQQAGVLTEGNIAKQAQILRDRLQKQAQEDQNTIQQQAQALRAGKTVNTTNANVQLRTGYNLVLAGHADVGLPFMQQALRRDGLRNPDDAKLSLVQAHVLQGQTAEAIAVLQPLAGPASGTREGASELAQLWLLYLAPPKH